VATNQRPEFGRWPEGRCRLRTHKAAGAKQKPVSVAFVGAIVPDSAPFRSEAFSRAGNLFQESVLEGLVESGLPPSIALSVEPISSFPRASRVLIRGRRTTLPGAIEIQLMPFINITPLKQLCLGLGVMWRLLHWSWLHRKESRVICTYNMTVPPGLFVWLSARLSRSKIVALLCDINIPGQTVPNGIWYRLDFWLHRCLIPRLNGAVVVADAIAVDFAAGVPTMRMEGGIRSDILDKLRRLPRKSGNEFVIGVAGSLDTTNGIDTVLAAFRQLPGDCRLRVAGKGPLEGEVKRAAAADSRIDYLGFVSLDQVLELYSSADVLVAMRPTKGLKTRYFFPSKVMEYLASGTPVVATATGHVEKEFGEFVYLLRDETADGLAKLLMVVRGEPASARAERGARGNRHMATHKTWNAQAARVATFLRRVANSDTPAIEQARLNN